MSSEQGSDHGEATSDEETGDEYYDRVRSRILKRYFGQSSSEDQSEDEPEQRQAKKIQREEEGLYAAERLRAHRAYMQAAEDRSSRIDRNPQHTGSNMLSFPATRVPETEGKTTC